MNGSKVRLDAIQPDDLAIIDMWMADVEVTAYFGYLGKVASPGESARWWEQRQSDETSRHLAIRRLNGSLIGRCAIFGINHRHQHAEFGILIGDKSAWGQGYGTDATRLMCDYGLYYLGLRNLFLWTYGYNARAQRAYVKAGFWEAGRMKDWIWFGEQWYDAILMQCNRESIGPTRVGILGAGQ
jgi:RimJ/RimL family protein N-acetyltransferase